MPKKKAKRAPIKDLDTSRKGRSTDAAKKVKGGAIISSSTLANSVLTVKQTSLSGKGGVGFMPGGELQ